jgi:hypothetical protein
MEHNIPGCYKPLTLFGPQLYKASLAITIFTTKRALSCHILL